MSSEQRDQELGSGHGGSGFGRPVRPEPASNTPNQIPQQQGLAHSQPGSGQDQQGAPGENQPGHAAPEPERSRWQRTERVEYPTESFDQPTERLGQFPAGSSTASYNQAPSNPTLPLPGSPSPYEPSPYAQAQPDPNSQSEVGFTPPAGGFSVPPGGGMPPAGGAVPPGGNGPVPPGGPIPPFGGYGAPTPGAVTTASRRGPGWFAVIAIAVVAALLGAVGAFTAGIGYNAIAGVAADSNTVSAPQQAEPPAKNSTANAPNWEDVAKAVAPSVVAITVQTGQGAAEGTGIILDARGTIVTNNHVVQGADRIAVTLHDGRTYWARTVGTDPSTDIAVIRLQDPPKGLKPATLGDSAKVVVGQPVMALGTPLGLQNTVTTGIVSAVNRPVSTSSDSSNPKDSAFTSAIQTDASINQGNSGGPLVDAQGYVIGINSAIASTGNGRENAGSIGLGFAIPVNTVKLIADQLISKGTAQHALLGVTATDGTATVGTTIYRGAKVVEIVPNSPAASGGLAVGDLVTKVDDVNIGSATALTAYVRSLPVGSSHKLTVLRGQDEKVLDIKLSSAD